MAERLRSTQSSMTSTAGRSPRRDPLGKAGQRTAGRDILSRPDLTWKHTSLLYSAERGDLTNDMVPISEEEADQIVERIRRRGHP